jgi:histidine decarboxylase
MSPAAERKAAPAELSLLGHEEPLPEAVIRERLESARAFLDERARRLLGYQANQDIDYAALGPFLGFNSNNIGDPYIDSNYGVHSRTFERAVLEFVARLFHVDDRKYWGYVTSGGTEANIYGIYVGRNYLEAVARRDGERAPQPMAFFSKDTHYSINKTMDMLRVPSETIPSDSLGRVRVDALIDAIVRNDPIAHPPLIIANLGSTFTGAYDDVEEIVRRLRERGIERYYLHVDAALGGFFLPFAERLSGLPRKVPTFDFRLPIHSVAFSGHKIIGTPIPCGVFMTLFDHLAYGNARQVEYIGSVDTTLAGSRSGLAPIALWYAIARTGTTGFVELARHMLDMADHAMKVLGEAGFRPWKNELGLSVIFDRPPEWVVKKWSLSTQGDFCHLYAMRHTTRARLDGLAEDLRTVRAVFAKSVAEETEKKLDRPLFLKSIDLFTSLEPEEIWKVARLTTERREEAGAFICHQGDDGDEMFIIVNGEVEIVDEHSGRAQVKYVARTGEAIGEIAVLTDLKRTAGLRCRTPVHLLVLKGTDFRTLLHRHPAISSRIIEHLAQRLVAATTA